MNNSLIKETYKHFFYESYQENIISSLELEFEQIQKAHDAIHKFLFLQPKCIPDGIEYFEKSAFLTLAYEVFHLAHRSCLDALTGHYNAAYTLLRTVYEMLIRGALFECLSDEGYRTNAIHFGYRKQSSKCIVAIASTGKIKDVSAMKHKKVTLSMWIKELIDLEPSIEQDLEDTSIAIYDKLEPILTDYSFQKKYVAMPSFRMMVKQLIDWKIIDVPEFLEIHDELYDFLSKNVHAIPDWTDALRRILNNESFLEIKVIQDELRKYMKYLLKVMDVAVVVELNLMKDWIQSDNSVKKKLKLEIKELEALSMKRSVQTLQNMLST